MGSITGKKRIKWEWKGAMHVCFVEAVVVLGDSPFPLVFFCCLSLGNKSGLRESAEWSEACRKGALWLPKSGGR